MWKIVQIFDGDYGCEELELGAKQKVSVTLENENGGHRILSVEDDWLVEKGLDVGSVWEEEAMADNTFEQISQEEAKEIMDTTEEYVILDVREQDEYDEGHIPGAVCYPYTSIDGSFSDAYPDSDQLFLVYCRSGNRSKIGAQNLADLGYTNVKEFGGINTWPFEIEP